MFDDGLFCAQRCEVFPNFFSSFLNATRHARSDAPHQDAIFFFSTTMENNNNNAKKMLSNVQLWRSSRDHALEIFDVCLDVISRLSLLKDERLYPEEEEEEDEEEDGEKETRDAQKVLSMETTFLKQMEQLGALLEKMDRERDRLKQLVNEMEKVFRDSELAHRKRVQETTSATSMGSISVRKGGEKTMLESLERIEAMWRFYGEETSACEVLFGLCREAAATEAARSRAETKKKKRSNESGEEIAKSARAFLEVRRKVDLERY